MAAMIREGRTYKHWNGFHACIAVDCGIKKRNVWQKCVKFIWKRSIYVEYRIDLI